MPSDLTVTAAEANRRFSKLLGAAREGKTITITAYGEPVAQLGPVPEEERAAAEAARRREAQRRLIEHLESVTPVVVGPWTRDELYERD